MPESISKLRIDQKGLAALCRTYNVSRLAVFGSTLQGEEKPSSDLDLLVEFDARHIPDIFTFVELEQLLGNFFRKKVDLNTPKFIHPAFREEILHNAVPIYPG